MNLRSFLIPLSACLIFSCTKNKSTDPAVDANVTFSDTVQGLMVKQTLVNGSQHTDSLEHYSLSAKVYGNDSAMKVTMIDPNGNIVQEAIVPILVNEPYDGGKWMTGGQDSCLGSYLRILADERLVASISRCTALTLWFWEYE